MLFFIGASPCTTADRGRRQRNGRRGVPAQRKAVRAAEEAARRTALAQPLSRTKSGAQWRTKSGAQRAIAPWDAAHGAGGGSTPAAAGWRPGGGRGAAAAVSAGPGGGGKRTLVRGGRQGGRRRPCESGAGVNAQQRRMTIAALAARRDRQRWLHTWRGGEGGTPLLLGGGAPLCDADRVCARHSRYVTTKGSGSAPRAVCLQEGHFGRRHQPHGEGTLCSGVPRPVQL